MERAAALVFDFAWKADGSILWEACPPPERAPQKAGAFRGPRFLGRGMGPAGDNKRSSERTAEDGTERSDVGSPGAAGYVRGGAPDEIMGGAGVQDAQHPNGVPPGARCLPGTYP